ncbi:MAG TPA: CoA transferase [Caulobacteraceae bacterium]
MAAERARRSDGLGREIRIPLSDLAIASLGHLGQIGEVTALGQDRPRMGNQLFGAFGRDFTTGDGERLMVVAITPRQWTGLVGLLGLIDEITRLEAEVGARLDRDEGVRFQHRDRLNPLIAAAIAARTSADLAAAFAAGAMCWSRYQNLKEAVDQNPDFSAANPLLAEIDHPSGRRYLAPGAAATISSEPRQPPAPAPRLGQHTDEVLSRVLGLSDGEIARLHGEGLVANA